MGLASSTTVPRTVSQLLNSNLGPGSSLSNSAAETIISPSPDYSLPGGTLAAGTALKICARGLMGGKAATPGSIHWRLRYGGLAGTLLLIDSNPGIASVAGVTNAGWCYDALVTVQSVGTSGVVFASAYNNFKDSPGFVPYTGGGTATINTTTANAIVLTAQFSLADVANIIQVQSFTIEMM